mmetsp:Transcript_27816/g.61261  ORF Transcript_27816/g.61261 Transcript_27816/m.61261 type:complete len:508 (-) Transcript_27816:257-1780(-)
MSTSRYMRWFVPSLLLFSSYRTSPLTSFFSNNHNHRFVSSLTSISFNKSRSKSFGRQELSKMTLASTATNDDLSSVSNFVRSVKQRVVDSNSFGDTKSSALPHLVMGNEAGDADSILSAIGLSYVRALQNSVDGQNKSDELIVPIVSIPADSLKFLRPETTFLLLNCAGMDNAKDDVNDLIAIDQTDLLPKKATLTLVDHNFFRGKESYEWTVTKIVDHHLDEGKHLKTCPPSNRKIAFEDTRALVASTTTLVAEDFYASAGTSKMPSSLAVLLLGTILLDSVNMSPKAGKGTQRDQTMIKQLLRNTDWSQITLPDNILVINDDGKKGNAPDPTKLFDKLQSAKFASDFWNGLTPEQAIRMDLKSFSIPTAIQSSFTSSLGIASILMEMNHFFDLHEDNLLETLTRVIEEDQSELFGLMFSIFGDGQRRRQLALASYDKPTLDRLINYLTVDNATTPDLELEVLHREEVNVGGTGEILYLVRMEQGNVKASRKQVAPILMEFFKKHR